MQRGRIGAEQIGRAAREAGPAVGRRGLRLSEGLPVGAGGQNRLDGAVVRAVVRQRPASGAPACGRRLHAVVS